MKKYSNEELEILKNGLTVYAHAYICRTGKKLTTVEQIIDAINEGIFTCEDVYFSHIDDVLRNNEQESIFWEDNMELFDYQNYFAHDKDVADGSWIKIRTANGFEVHYAKRSIRKRRFNEELTAEYKKLNKLMSKQINVIKSDVKTDAPINKVLDEKIKKQRDKILMLRVYTLIGFKPYEVAIKRTKTKSEYYLPYQYEIVDDISDFTDGYINSIVGLDLKARTGEDNEDKVFYLRSRGIGEGMARLMASLNQSYFIINLDAMIDEYNKQVNESLVIIEK